MFGCSFYQIFESLCLLLHFFSSSCRRSGERSCPSQRFVWRMCVWAGVVHRCRLRPLQDAGRQLQGGGSSGWYVTHTNSSINQCCFKLINILLEQETLQWREVEKEQQQGSWGTCINGKTILSTKQISACTERFVMWWAFNPDFEFCLQFSPAVFITFWDLEIMRGLLWKAATN